MAGDLGGELRAGAGRQGPFPPVGAGLGVAAKEPVQVRARGFPARFPPARFPNDEVQDALSERLRGGVPEQALRGAVLVQDTAVGAEHDYRLGGGLDQWLEPIAGLEQHHAHRPAAGPPGHRHPQGQHSGQEVDRGGYCAPRSTQPTTLPTACWKNTAVRPTVNRARPSRYQRAKVVRIRE